jgi:hypothetical protein
MSETENQNEVKEVVEKLEKATIDDKEDGTGTTILGFEKEDPFKEAGEDAAGTVIDLFIHSHQIRYYPFEINLTWKKEIDNYSRFISPWKEG